MQHLHIPHQARPAAVAGSSSSSRVSSTQWQCQQCVTRTVLVRVSGCVTHAVCVQKQAAASNPPPGLDMRAPNTPRPPCPHTPMRSYVFCRQRQDESLRRGGEQASVVVLSLHPLSCALLPLSQAAGHAFFSEGPVALAAASCVCVWGGGGACGRLGCAGCVIPCVLLDGCWVSHTHTQRTQPWCHHAAVVPHTHTHRCTTRC
jgi:hypothetical protein